MIEYMRLVDKMNTITPSPFYKRMDPALKAKWVKALESGAYVQGRGQLRTKDNTYCCLGVLCEVAGLAWIRRDDGEYAIRDRWAEEEGYETDACARTDSIPSDRCEIFGLTYEAQKKLIDLNDRGQFDFKRIATWIKENL